MKLRIMKAIRNLILGIIAISTWYGCEISTVNHPKYTIFDDTREIVDTMYLHDNGKYVELIIPTEDTLGFGS